MTNSSRLKGGSTKGNSGSEPTFSDTVCLQVNGEVREVRAVRDARLLHVLRNDLELNGPKFGCGLGNAEHAPSSWTDCPRDRASFALVAALAEPYSPSRGSAPELSQTRSNAPLSWKKRRNAGTA